MRNLAWDKLVNLFLYHWKFTYLFSINFGNRMVTAPRDRRRVSVSITASPARILIEQFAEQSQLGCRSMADNFFHSDH